MDHSRSLAFQHCSSSLKSTHCVIIVSLLANFGERNHGLVRGLPRQPVVRANTEGAGRLVYRSESWLDVPEISVTKGDEDPTRVPSKNERALP